MSRTRRNIEHASWYRNPHTQQEIRENHAAELDGIHVRRKGRLPLDTNEGNLKLDCIMLKNLL